VNLYVEVDENLGLEFIISDSFVLGLAGDSVNDAVLETIFHRLVA